jgi:hypothetical protein
LLTGLHWGFSAQPRGALCSRASEGSPSERHQRSAPGLGGHLAFLDRRIGLCLEAGILLPPADAAAIVADLEAKLAGRTTMLDEAEPEVATGARRRVVDCATRRVLSRIPP